jgi:hypothetical protein
MPARTSRAGSFAIIMSVDHSHAAPPARPEKDAETGLFRP